MADRAAVGHADQQRRQPEAGRRAALVWIALRPALTEPVLSGRLAELQEIEQELAIVRAHLQRVARQDLRGVDVEAVRGRIDDEVVERFLSER